MPRKKKETMDQFVARRKDETNKDKAPKGTTFKKEGKEKGKVPFFETKSHPLAAGRHPLIGLQRHKGIVKKKMAKKLEKVAHLRKKGQIEKGTD